MQKKLLKFQNADLYSIDFHYVLKRDRKYNINVHLEPLRTEEDLRDNSVRVKIDINTYEAFKHDPEVRYKDEVFSELGEQIQNYFDHEVKRFMEEGVL